jgi:G:T-mismatch repair DNA endonuclease (very short patch repair protein)
MRKKKSSYSKLLKKAKAAARRESNPEAYKARKTKKLKRNANKMSKKMTEPERKFAMMMKEIGVEFEPQKVIKNKIYDFYIPSKNMIVEIHGDYWHANPIIYENKELNNIQIRNIKNDKYKTTLAKGNGFLLEVVWEYDLKNNYEKQKKRFKKLLKDG